MLDQAAFDLERPDAIPRRGDDIIRSPDEGQGAIPAVFRGIAGQIVGTGIAGGRLLLPVASEPVERRVGAVNGELTRLTGVDLAELFVQQRHAEAWQWSTHRARMANRLHRMIVADDHTQFGLAVL